jgi:SAM-dependent methyltransferase
VTIVARWFDRALRRRADHLAERLLPHLPGEGCGIDLGCGTGHNVARLSAARPRLRWIEADVAGLGADLKLVGPPPVGFETNRPLPFDDASVNVVMLAFVLHYAADDVALLRECRRLLRGDGRLILLQSTETGPLAKALLRARELALGRGAQAVARRLGVVGENASGNMVPSRYYRRNDLLGVCAAAGWVLDVVEPERWPMTGLSRDLIVLRCA